MLAEVIRIAAAGRGIGLLGFHEPDVFADFLRGNGFIQTIAHKQRLTQIIEAEIAARALHGVLALAVATDHALHALGGDAVGVVHHLDKDELAVSAVSFVHVEDSMGSGAGTGKGIENNGILFAIKSEQVLNKLYRFRKIKTDSHMG